MERGLGTVEFQAQTEKLDGFVMDKSYLT
jgi:hypothetical protein